MRTHHDPIDMVKAKIVDKGWSTEEELKAIDKEVKAIVSASAEFAKESPEPDPSELYTDVLVEA